MIYENENIEFKLQFTEDLYKEVIAFANTNGGVIHIGIDNSGNAVGVNDVDETYMRITNGIRDAITPDITMFVKYSLQDNYVINISVAEGAYKPYYLKAKGLKPNGVFVRQGASSVPASPEQIRAMIKESDGDEFEKMRSMNQSLTFDYASAAFNHYGIEFSKEKYRVLGMVDESNELYTNLGLILSDQCAHTVKVAVFADETNTVFRDSKEFAGSVFKQLDDTFAYLNLCNKKMATFKGLERIEKADYPEEALREALLNALVHRDYSFSGSIIININDQKMEFISIGGLLPGLSPEDIRSGISQPRNKNLAEVFHRLHLIESYGTGIRRIYRMYEHCSVQPQIEITANTFKMILPNMNVAAEVKTTKTSGKVTGQKQTLLNYLEVHGRISDAGIQELLGIKKTRAFVIVKQMCEEGLIAARGRGVNKEYRLQK